MQNCAVCLKEFSAGALRDHEAACSEPPLTLSEVTKMLYALQRENASNKRKVDSLTREVKALRFVPSPSEGAEFPLLTEQAALLTFLSEGLTKMVANHEWNARVNGKSFFMYDAESKTWASATVEQERDFTWRIRSELHALHEAYSKKQNKREYEAGPYAENLNKIYAFTETDVKRALNEKQK